MALVKSKKWFIDKAIKVHGDKYDYSDSEYNGTLNKIKIKCNRCGNEFEQYPKYHLSGCGCTSCNRNDIWNKRGRITTEEFIEKAIKVHCDKYDYSKVEYINNSTKVCIICQEHGEFYQTPNNHLRGQGCPSCSKNFKLSTKSFIEKSKQIHGNTYNYGKVNYINAKTDVEIICLKHGMFKQEANAHLQGHGCPYCCESHLESEITQFLTIKKIEFIKQYKTEWLKKQSLDFYLPQYKIAIECQGIQHFQAVDYFGGKKNFEFTIKRDDIKRKLCMDNNIKLVFYSNLGIDYPYEVYEDKEKMLLFILNYGKEKINS